MAVTWWVFPAQSRATLILAEPYTFDDWKMAMSDILSSADLPGVFSLLVDRRHSRPPSSEFVERMIGFFRDNEARLSEVRAGVLVDSAAAMGLARMVETLTDLRVGTFRLRTFYGILEAEAWLQTGDHMALLRPRSVMQAGLYRSFPNILPIYNLTDSPAFMRPPSAEP